MLESLRQPQKDEDTEDIQVKLTMLVVLPETASGLCSPRSKNKELKGMSFGASKKEKHLIAKEAKKRLAANEWQLTESQHREVRRLKFRMERLARLIARIADDFTFPPYALQQLLRATNCSSDIHNVCAAPDTDPARIKISMER